MDVAVWWPMWGAQADFLVSGESIAFGGLEIVRTTWQDWVDVEKDDVISELAAAPTPPTCLRWVGFLKDGDDQLELIRRLSVEASLAIRALRLSSEGDFVDPFLVGVYWKVRTEGTPAWTSRTPGPLRSAPYSEGIRVSRVISQVDVEHAQELLQQLQGLHESQRFSSFTIALENYIDAYSPMASGRERALQAFMSMDALLSDWPEHVASRLPTLGTELMRTNEWWTNSPSATELRVLRGDLAHGAREVSVTSGLVEQLREVCRLVLLDYLAWNRSGGDLSFESYLETRASEAGRGR